MGWRAIRVGLDRPAMLRQQLRALIRAAAGRELHLMFPMIAEVDEFDRARAVLALELERERALGGAVPSKLRVGAMLEVPSLVYQLPQLLARADFISIGSNDLLQFHFAVDRNNPRLAERYDLLSPSALTMMRRIIIGCAKLGVEVSLCGEAGSQPLEAMALIGLGLRSFSVASPAIGAVKLMVRSLEVGPLAAYLVALLGQSDHSLRKKLKDYASDHGIAI